MNRPQLLWIATGGTIAATAATSSATQSYCVGHSTEGTLEHVIPALSALADLHIVQPFHVGSEHLSSAHWLQLAHTLQTCLSERAYEGVLISHGTDTLEETALFLDLICPRTHAWVMTGAMRPATALSADGPRNLYAAARVALDPASRHAGVLVVLQDEIFAADRVAKQHTTQLMAFHARDAMPLGNVLDDQPIWHIPPAAAAQRRPNLSAHCNPLPAALPRVAMLCTHVDADPAIVDWYVQRGARALVVAGTGHGTLAQPMLNALISAQQQGCWIIRASRLPAGPVCLNAGGISDQKHGFIAAYSASAHKARLVVSLALACGYDSKATQALLQAL